MTLPKVDQPWWIGSRCLPYGVSGSLPLGDRLIRGFLTADESVLLQQRVV